MADIGIVVFPGSNCERDAYHVLKDVLRVSVTYHWHKDPLSKDYKAVILPGGFSYGDYLRGGAIAKLSPAIEGLGEMIAAGKLVLGICNGFQVLVEGGFLPGALAKNDSLRFQCEDVHVRVESNASPFLCQAKKGEVLRLPIAHSEGRYVAEEETISHLEENHQVALRYVGPQGELTDAYNANGSIHAIAGVTNEKGNVLGLMPHPERASEKILGNTDGLTLLRSMVASL